MCPSQAFRDRGKGKASSLIEAFSRSLGLPGRRQSRDNLEYVVPKTKSSKYISMEKGGKFLFFANSCTFRKHTPLADLKCEYHLCLALGAMPQAWLTWNLEAAINCHAPRKVSQISGRGHASVVGAYARKDLTHLLTPQKASLVRLLGLGLVVGIERHLDDAILKCPAALG